MTTEQEELADLAQDALDNAQGLTPDDLDALQEAVDALRKSQAVEPFGYVYRVVTDDERTSQRPWSSRDAVFEIGPPPAIGVRLPLQYVPLYTAPQPAPINSIRVDIENVGICDIPVRDGVAYMPAITVADIVKRAQPTPVDAAVVRDAAFNPAFDFPATPEQALAVIKVWGSPSAMTFSSKRAAAAAKLIEQRFHGANSSLVIADALGEVERATEKFPTWPTDPLHAVAVLNEEVGELNKAVLQCTYEPHKSGPKDVRDEAIQTAAMAIRFLMSLDKYVYAPGEQHTQDAAIAAQQQESGK